MLSLTKIFHFEMAHAIHGYPGACKNIHGHSYQLQVTVTANADYQHFIPSPGFILDFRELKQLVTKGIIQILDHKLVLSDAYIAAHPAIATQENLVYWEAEPTAENLLIYMKDTLRENLPDHVELVRLKLFETGDSFAEWTHDTIAV